MPNILEQLKGSINWIDLPFVCDPACLYTARARAVYSMTERCCPICGKTLIWMPQSRNIDQKADVHEIVPRSAFGEHVLARQYGAINLVPYALRLGVCHLCNVNRRPDNYNGRVKCANVKISHLGLDIVEAAILKLEERFSGTLDTYTEPIKEAIHESKRA